MGHLASSIHIEAVGLSHHATEKRDVNGVVDIHQVLRFQVFEGLFEVVCTSDGNHGLSDVFKLLGRDEHQESCFLELGFGHFLSLLFARLFQFEANLGEGDLSKASSLLCEFGITCGDLFSQQFDDQLGANAPVALGKAGLEVLARGPLDGL